MGRPRPRVCRFLCHELSEFLALTDHAYLFDGLPGLRAAPNTTSYIYHYQGGGDPSDIRRRIARPVEELCFQR